MKQIFFLFAFFSIQFSFSQSSGLFPPSVTSRNAAPYEVIINEIMADVNPAPNNLPVYDYVELLNLTNDTISLSGWTISWGAQEKIFPEGSKILPESYLILSDDNSDYEDYGDFIAFLNFPVNVESNMILQNNNGVLIHSIDYKKSWYHDDEKDDGGWSLEQIDPTNPCGGINNWNASYDERGGTPGEQNSAFGNNPDEDIPSISDVLVLSEHLIKILFSETIIISPTLENPTNFQINNGVGTAETIEIISSQEINVSFSQNIQENTIYTLLINAILEDCAGNQNENPSFMFSLFFAHKYDIVINEIMADPSPVVSNLPEFEYIELYNTTAYPIKLEGWSLLLGNTIKNFEDGAIIGPHAYLILADEDAGFQGIGPTVGFSSFSISNSGVELQLLNSDNNLIHFVGFTDNWYDSEYKKEGGWSLEMIDPENPCAEDKNWTASMSENGGTPGKQNSVLAPNPDNNSPVLLRAGVKDSVTIILYFDESVESEMLNPSIFEIDNAMGTPLSVAGIAPAYKRVELILSQSMLPQTIYTVSIIDNLTDCVGNSTTVDNIARFAIPQKPNVSDLIINEILSNPFTDNVDFVELYNLSHKVIDLKTLTLAKTDEVSMILEDINNISADYYLFFPEEYILLSENQKAVKSAYFTENPHHFIDMEGFPRYNSDEGVVVLAAKNEEIIDMVSYNENMHFALLNSTKGVSLERIHPEGNSKDENNWHSAAESVGFASPAMRNSQFIISNMGDGKINLSPDIFSPDNDGYNDILQISYVFSETGYVANVYIYDAYGRIIKQLENNTLLGTEGSFHWDGTDNNRQKAPIGTYIVFFEVFDLDGNVKKYKEVTVLGGRL